MHQDLQSAGACILQLTHFQGFRTTSDDILLAFHSLDYNQYFQLNNQYRHIQPQSSLMHLTLTSNYSSPLSSPSSSTPIAPVQPSFTGTISGSESLRARRGVTFKISLAGTNVPAKGHLEPHFSNLPRRQRPLTPLRSATLGGTSSGLKSGSMREIKTPLRSATLLSVATTSDLRSGRARDFGMAMDGWTTLQE